jgi:hypothetical protein
MLKVGGKPSWEEVTVLTCALDFLRSWTGEKDILKCTVRGHSSRPDQIELPGQGSRIWLWTLEFCDRVDVRVNTWADLLYVGALGSALGQAELIWEKHYLPTLPNWGLRLNMNFWEDTPHSGHNTRQVHPAGGRESHYSIPQRDIKSVFDWQLGCEQPHGPFPCLGDCRSRQSLRLLILRLMDVNKKKVFSFVALDYVYFFPHFLWYWEWNPGPHAC